MIIMTATKPTQATRALTVIKQFPFAQDRPFVPLSLSSLCTSSAHNRRMTPTLSDHLAGYLYKKGILLIIL